MRASYEKSEQWVVLSAIGGTLPPVPEERRDNAAERDTLPAEGAPHTCTCGTSAGAVPASSREGKCAPNAHLHRTQVQVSAVLCPALRG
jgi:hypothetical protein